MLIKTLALDNHIDGTKNFVQNLSFDSLINYLKNQIAALHTHESTFPKLILDRIDQLQQENGQVSMENYAEFEEIFNYVYYLTSNDLRQDDIFWGLGFPIPDQVFYGQNNFYSLIDSDMILIEEQMMLVCQDFNFSNKLLYMIVLQRLYSLPVSEIKYLYQKKIKGVNRYYQLNVDFTFLNILTKGELPLLDRSCLLNKDIQTFADIIPLLKSIDLAAFEFHGFTILKFIDVTSEHINEKIHNLISQLPSTDVISDLSSFNRELIWGELKDMVRSITKSDSVESSFFPLLELNGFPVLSSELGRESVFFGELIKREMTQCHSTIFTYLKDPYTITYGIEEGLDSLDHDLIDHLRAMGLTSYVCFPLKHKDNLVGFLELYSKEILLEKQQLMNLASFLPSFSTLATDLVVTFKNSIDKVILDKYTSLQDAVQWKFNNVAANYLNDISSQKYDTQLEKIKFEKVYPIYGAVDVRNSTKLRNIAYKKDSYQRIGLLQLMVDQMEGTNLSEEENKFIEKFNIVKDWLDNGQVDYYLLDILYFFHEDVADFLKKLQSLDPIVDKVKKQYVEENLGKHGVVNGASEHFEFTLAKLNAIISKELVGFNAYVQEQFPSYFEKFRTDGIEYDMYIGQSITPTKVFNDAILRDIRKKQIASMVTIARKTYEVIDELPVSLVTTQLVFVHPNSIDISFRQDERRFDVEGGYNIRYEVIKKRIDKALVKGSKERLVQPNKIAIVYSSNRIEQEIRYILDELVEENLIEFDYENLVLDELQGIEELRAFRVSVSFQAIN